MFSKIRSFATLSGLILIAYSVGTCPAPAQKKSKSPPPKLVVVAVFDQMRADYLEKWRPHFCEGGFKRLLREGASFSECHYPYAYTLTAPGHTSLATGTTPSVHGIVANEWYSRADDKEVQSITPPAGPDRPKGLGPYRRRVGTVGDQLLADPRRKGRVFAMAIKDRAAILMAALRSLFCYWFVDGNFVTSPYYGDEKRKWVEEFNKNKADHADAWLNKSWGRFMDDEKLYAAVAGPDPIVFEGEGYNQTNVFPHPFVAGAPSKSDPDGMKAYYKALANSPMGGELLWKFAKKAIHNEKIGQGDDTDLLFLGFSSNDYVGHCYGPDSQEVFDMTLRSDALVKEILENLDATVGKGNYVFIVSADHGVCPIPELQQQKLGEENLPDRAGVIPPEVFGLKTNAFLNDEFTPKGEKEDWYIRVGKSDDGTISLSTNGWITLDRAVLAARRLDPATVQRRLAEWLKKDPGIADAFTRAELDDTRKPLRGPFGQAVRLSYHPEECGDVFVVVKQHHVIRTPIADKNSRTYRTTHGSPYRYDTRVPFLVSGPGVIAGSRLEPTTPLILANTVADLIGIQRLPHAVIPPAGLIRK